MKKLNHIFFACSLTLLGACAEEVPPISIAEFMEKPRLLEAAMVRCGQNRSEMKYVVECVNARDAVNRLAAAEEQAKRQQMEAQSERKRQALRRTQEAAAEARRRALEAQRMREEAEYLGLFEQLPAGGEPGQPQPQQIPEGSPQVNTPVRDVPAPPIETVDNSADTVPTEEEKVASDLNSIREELRRRQDQPE